MAFKHFDFADGSNPYISTKNSTFWLMLKNYDIVQTGAKDFKVLQWRKEAIFEKSDYKSNKNILRVFAIQWQAAFDNFDYSYRDLAEWADFFGEYGKRYGLLTEFKGNGIPC